jgi:small subunit ribosomal protein S4
LLGEKSSFDDVLELSIDDISKRRLTSLVVSKGFARTPKQARQFITHKHIIVGGRKVGSPNYLVLKDEEDSINFADNSPFKERDHPLIDAIKKVNKKSPLVKKK